jgi:hypothetical protein
MGRPEWRQGRRGRNTGGKAKEEEVKGMGHMFGKELRRSGGLSAHPNKNPA